MDLEQLCINIGKGEMIMNSQENLSLQAHQVIREVQKAVIGKEECIRKVMMAILSSGHILLEDIPGVGKTTMALAFSKALNLKENRLTFTPDVLPADLTGFTMYRKETGKFYYQPGAVMCNLFLGDEINRTSPRTQSALLEVMEEGQISVDGVTHPLPRPFIVIATQNPAGSAGTQLLPQSQLDRFTVCLTMGYPDIREEISILKGRIAQNTIEQVSPAADAAELIQMQEEVRRIFIHDRIYHYIGTLVQATRTNSMVELGVSPRGTLALARMSQASAYLRNKTYVTPDDIREVFMDVCAHRIILNAKARISHLTPAAVLEEILKATPGPSLRKS